jgi:hypothetical protein
MNKLVLVLAGLALSSTALAGASSYAEFALVTGGEGDTSRNSGGKENGFEFARAWAFNENWYVGGIAGEYDQRDSREWTYFDINGGYVKSINPKTDLTLEGGFWFGENKESGTEKREPKVLEAKAGVNTMLSDNFSVFGTLSLVGGDTDNQQGDNNDDISNFIYSLGGAYSFTETVSLNVKLVNGVNGVNGQDEVLRIGGRWTF